jgi:hypothetical protein
MAIDSFIFGGNTGLTYEQLKRRRAVAAALAAQRRGYPKTVGEGLTYLGESIGDTLAERRLDAAEQELQGRRERLMGGVPGMGAPPSAAPLAIPPAAPRPPTSVRPQQAPRPAPAAPPISAAAPAPSLRQFGPPVGEFTQGYAEFPGPSGEGLTSGPPPSEFGMGGILNAAPLAAPNLEPAFPGEQGATSQAGILPSSGYLPPATAAAPPSPAPISPTVAPSAPNFMDTAGWPTGPRRDLLSNESAPLPEAAPAAPAARPQSINLTPQQRDILIRTVYGEASNQDDIGQQAVANVILNRARLAGTAPDYEALKKNQFEPWWNAKARARMERLSTEDPAYRRAQQAVDAALSGDDPTGGATHFYSPSVQAALGRRMPSWDRGDSQMIGTHKFLRLPYGGQQPVEDGADVLAGGTQVASLAPAGMGGAPIPGMGGAGSPRLQPQIPPLQGPPPAPEETGITPTDIEPMPATAQFGRERFVRTDAPTPGVTAPATPAPPAPAVSAPQGPSRPAVSEDLTQPLPEPTPPAYPDKLTPEEEYGWRMQAASGGDPTIDERAKQWIANGKAKRDAQYLREVELYKADIQFVRQENAERLKRRRAVPETEQAYRKGEEEIAGKQREADIAKRFGSVKTYETLVTDLGKSHEKASSAAAVLPNLYDAKEMSKNAITGFGADARLDYNRALNAFGLTATGDKVRDTQALQAAIAPLVGAILKSTTGTTQVSEGDRKFAQQAAGGDITLDAPAIQRILDIGERSFKANIASHNKQLGSVFTDPQGQDRALHARYRVDMPLSAADQAAQEWLAQNPNDPRAAAVRRKLGIQ